MHSSQSELGLPVMHTAKPTFKPAVQTASSALMDSIVNMVPFSIICIDQPKSGWQSQIQQKRAHIFFHLIYNSWKQSYSELYSQNTIKCSVEHLCKWDTFYTIWLLQPQSL